MKNTVKTLVCVLIITIGLTALAGCGKPEEKDTNSDTNNVSSQVSNTNIPNITVNYDEKYITFTGTEGERLNLSKGITGVVITDGKTRHYDPLSHEGNEYNETFTAASGIKIGSSLTEVKAALPIEENGCYVINRDYDEISLDKASGTFAIYSGFMITESNELKALEAKNCFNYAENLESGAQTEFDCYSFLVTAVTFESDKVSGLTVIRYDKQYI